MITLDGSYGEGGGQMLRSALALSMCTGQPFTMHNIRAKRSKPGLLRQHLTAVKASQQISHAEVKGMELGSKSLTFIPKTISGGDYKFDIGSAGSSTLVLQTILPALLKAPAKSTVTITGGTHNQSAPPADFLQKAFLPLLAKMGAQVQLTIRRHGFYPAGGGEIVVEIEPCPQLQPLHLLERGEPKKASALSVIAGLPGHIAERELKTVCSKMGWTDEQGHIQSVRAVGHGNVLMLLLENEHVANVFTHFGEHGVSAEKVAGNVCKEAKAFLHSHAAVDEYLADQLLLPIALAGAGSYTSTYVSSHCESNMAVIQAFLPVSFATDVLSRDTVKISLC